MEKLTQYAVPGILALLIIKEVFSFVKMKSNGKACDACKFKKTHCDVLHDLHEWHKPDPETGRFAWYERDTEIIKAVSKIGNDIVHEIREFRKTWKNGK